MDTLSKLFGGGGIVKILRMFLFNPDEAFEVRDIAKRTKVDSDVVRNEISMLAKIGFLERKSFYREQGITHRRRGDVLKSSRPRRVRVQGWKLIAGFPYLAELRALLVGATPAWSEELARRFRNVGNLKVVIASGVFVGSLDSRLDILLVGENIRKAALLNSIKNLEAELGREIRYAIFTTQDFKYRLGIYDRLVRDVLDYRHEKVIDRLGMGT
jgi:hypothetical protein